MKRVSPKSRMSGKSSLTLVEYWVLEVLSLLSMGPQVLSERLMMETSYSFLAISPA